MFAQGFPAVVRELRDRLLAGDGQRISRVILFGSQAVGKGGPGSDLDVLVVEDELRSKRQEAVRLRRAVGDLPYPMDIVVMSEEESQETKDVIGGLAYPAHRYGVVIYERE